MANQEIRDLIAKRRLKHFEVAEAIGIHPTYLSHLLQRELPQERKKHFIEVIKKMSV